MALEYPERLQIQKNLTGALEEINEANGYKHDMAGRVFRGRMVYGDDDPIPLLSILEVPIPLDQLPSPEDSDYSSGGWELMIQGWVDDDRFNPTDPAHILMADVRKRLTLERHKVRNRKPEDGILGLGNLVTNLRVGPGVVRPADEVSAKAYFWLTITLDVAEDLADPYHDEQ